MLAGAALALCIASGWTLLAVVVGIGIGRSAANREWERKVERELRRRSGDPHLRLVSGQPYSFGRSADPDEPVVHEHRDELRPRRHL